MLIEGVDRRKRGESTTRASFKTVSRRGSNDIGENYFFPDFELILGDLIFRKRYYLLFLKKFIND